MTNLLDDLAPCPFCGGSAEVRTPTESDGFALHISCRCGAQLWGHKRHFRDAEEAVAAWNRRTHAAEIKRNARDAEKWRQQQEKRIPSVTYGCHCDLDPGQSPDGCVIDDGQRDLCILARNIECKEQCEHWRPIDTAMQEGEG